LAHHAVHLGDVSHLIQPRRLFDGRRGAAKHKKVVARVAYDVAHPASRQRRRAQGERVADDRQQAVGARTAADLKSRLLERVLRVVGQARRLLDAHEQALSFF
jgi:hypothetical protein